MAGRNLFAETPQKGRDLFAQPDELAPINSGGKAIPPTPIQVIDTALATIPHLLASAGAEITGGLTETAVATAKGSSAGRKAGDGVRDATRRVLAGEPSEKAQRGMAAVGEVLNAEPIQEALASVEDIQTSLRNIILQRGGSPELAGTVSSLVLAIPEVLAGGTAARPLAIGAKSAADTVASGAGGALVAATDVAQGAAARAAKLPEAIGEGSLRLAEGATRVAGKGIDMVDNASPSARKDRQRAQAALERGETLNKDAAGYRLEDGKLVVDEPAMSAIDHGFERQLVSTLRAANEATKAQARAIIDLRDRRERGLLSARSASIRGADTVGGSIGARYDYLRSVANEARKQQRRSLEGLNGKPIDLTEVTNNFFERLDEMRITVKDGRLDFSNSRFALNDASQRKMQEFVSRLANAGAVDARKAHEYKVGIDDMVGYGRDASDGLTGEVESFMKGFRYDLNQAIRQVSDEYASANDTISDVIDTIQEANDLIGRKYDPTDRNFGLLSRKILTNYKDGSRVNDLISDLDAKVKQYSADSRALPPPGGGRFDDDIVALTELYTDINRVIGTDAKGSLQGIFQGSDARRGMGEIIADRAAKEMNALREQDRFSALEALRGVVE